MTARIEKQLGVSEQEAWKLARQAMTDAQFDAFELRFDSDFSIAEIAILLGISRQAVTARLEGGRRRLLKAMKEAA